MRASCLPRLSAFKDTPNTSFAVERVAGGNRHVNAAGAQLVRATRALPKVSVFAVANFSRTTGTETDGYAPLLENSDIAATQFPPLKRWVVLD
jgi:hypothetical protein